jgi:molecular chaperone GrpE
MEDKEKESLFEEAAPEGALAEEPCGGPGEGEETPGTDEAADLKTRLAYLTAEFDNFRKRAAREREAQAAFGNEQLLRAILPFLDNLERAMDQSEASTEAVLAGVRMTHGLFLAELRKFGLEQVVSVGEPFDPARHEAIGSVAWEGKPEGTVLSEARKGYLLHGRLLRPAQVMVAAASSGDQAGGPGN